MISLNLSKGDSMKLTGMFEYKELKGNSDYLARRQMMLDLLKDFLEEVETEVEEEEVDKMFDTFEKINFENDRNLEHQLRIESEAEDKAELEDRHREFERGAK